MSDQEINNLIARKITFYMNQKNVSQQELAKYMGVSQATVSNWCKGIKMPRMNKIDKLCLYFGIKRSDLMEDNSHKSTPDSTIKIMEIYNQLNALGKQEAEKRVQELTYIPKYTTPDDHLILQAAHERTDIEVTDEMRKHDDDIMNDENF